MTFAMGVLRYKGLNYKGLYGNATGLYLEILMFSLKKIDLP